MSTITSPGGTPPAKRNGLHRILDWRPASVLARILVVLALVVPLLMSATFMWAMWDPSKTLPNVPLAIVNEDKGADNKGEFREVGDEVVKGLLDTDYLDFHEVSAEEAQEGLTKGDYLFVVTIPEDFSARTVSLISDQPRQSEIRVDYNDYTGTNGTVLTAALIPELQARISDTISETYATETLSGMNQLGDGIRRAADGSAKIDDGLGRLQDGTNRAQDGATQLDSGATQLDAGATRLGAGVSELTDGATQLNQGATRLDGGAHELNNGLFTLKDGTAQLGNGASQIDAGVQELTGMLIPLLEQVQGVVGQVRPVVDALNAVGMTAQAEQLNGTISKLDPANPTNMVAQLNRLRAGTQELSYNLNDPSSQYLSGVNRLVEGSTTLANGTTELKGGTDRLVEGTGRLSSGAVELKDGTTRLKDGTTQLVDGSVQLGDGVNQLKDGSTELNQKLTEGAENAPVVSRVPESAHQMAVPIVFEEANMHPAQGLVDESNPTEKKIESGFSLIVMLIFGYLVMAVLAALLPHVVGRRSESRTGAGPVLRAFGLMFLINLGIMAVFTAISVLTGWRPHNWASMGLVIALIAANGAALFQFFRVLFGRLVGGLFSVGFFALGLFVFGGVWPLATIPGPLQFFHALHPMSYARNAFVRSTDGLYDHTYWIGLAVLAGTTIVAALASIIIYNARRKGGATQLQEERVAEHESRLGEEPLTSVTY